jgi:predicted transcriptional regulator
MASNGTVKLVADITPQLKAALDRKAKRDGMTRRAAIEQAITTYVQGGKGK